MDKKAAISLIEKTFNQSFDKDQFTLFIKNFLNDVEPKSNTYSGNLIWDNFKDHIKAYSRIGKYIDPEGEALDVLIVHVESVSKLERARTALRNFVIKHLNTFDKDYALVAFYSKEDGGEDWRFSFIKLEYQSYLDEEKQKVKTRKEFTPAKRYSFLVGKYEKAHTAKNQILPLLQNIANNPTIKQIEDAFSIEKVTDEFFGKYRDLYLKLCGHFKNDKKLVNSLIDENIIEVEEAEKAAISRFTKKLLGQIVFIYFLQKKGWLGVKPSGNWGKDGNKLFLQDLYIEAKNRNKNYFKDYLQFLFYDALAKKRDNKDAYYKKFDCRIPFLNGGLFEADYEWMKLNLTIPNDLFRTGEPIENDRTGILDVFDRYNFTIKEDEPLDKEVAVDPEMLGKVFENMLEENERKGKGAFYTPREIVHYMCQESLIQYLDNALNGEALTSREFGSDQLSFLGNDGKTQHSLIDNEKSNIPKDDIEEFIRSGHLALENDVRVANKGETKTYKFQLPESIRINADTIDHNLENIRICDPAIGSGAFPVGLLHELVNAQLVLKPHFSKSYASTKTKKFELPKDYTESRYIYRLKKQIIQESIYGVDIDASAIDIARLRLWLSLVVDEDDLDPIETLPNLDYKIVRGNSLIGLPGVGADKYPQLQDELIALKDKFFVETDEKTKNKTREIINAKIQDVLETAETFEGYEIDFDYKLFFSEVWKEKGGFDIVIGNPPYLQIQYLSEEVKSILKKLSYKTFNLRGDIYEMFFERGAELLKTKGHLCYITSNKWMRANYGKSTRNYFLSKVNPKLLFDFGQEMVFSSAIVHSNILLFEKNKNQNILRGALMNKGLLKGQSLTNYFANESMQIQFSNDQVWSITSLDLINVHNRILNIGVKLSKWDNKISRGIITGLNEAFIISADEYLKLRTQKNNSRLKKIVRGRDTRKYYSNDSGKWIIISGHNEHKLITHDFPNLYNYLNKFEVKLKKRGQVRNGQHHWLELDNTPSETFFRKLDSEKIIFSEIVSEPQFCYDNKGLYPEATSFFLIGDNLKWLIAFLNSEPITLIFRLFYAGGELVGKFRYKKTFLLNLPIPEPIEKYEETIIKIVDYLTFIKDPEEHIDIDSSIIQFWEKLIDSLVYNVLFETEFKNAKKEIFSHLKDLQPINEGKSKEKKLAIIVDAFDIYYDREHPVRFSMETIDSIEPVRIIKEAQF